MMISVISTLYKGNKYVKQLQKMVEANAKILKIKHDVDVELILVNDYPNEEIELYEKTSKHYTVKVIMNSVNSGIHVSRVKGIAASVGEFILILDQDDKIKDVFLLSQYEKLRVHGDIVVCNGIKELHGVDKVIYHDKLKHNLVNCKEVYLMAANQIVSPGQCLIKKAAIPCAWIENPLNKNGSDDLFLWLLILNSGIRFKTNREQLYIHTMTGENLSDDLKNMLSSDNEMLDIAAKNNLLSMNDIKKRRRLILFLKSTKGEKNSALMKIFMYLKNIDIVLIKIVAYYI